MKFDTPKNPNYVATVVRVKTLVPLANADRLLGLPMFGAQAIVGLDNKVGDLGVLFPAEAQLSLEFTSYNNLFRHSEFNADKAAVGYLEDNRRVRAIKLRGHRSDALFLPLSCLAFTGVDLADLKEGDEFDVLNGHEICCKYVVRTREPRAQRQGKAIPKRVDIRQFPEHFDSTHYLKISDSIPDQTPIIVTQKIHGTSIRVGRTIVTRKLTWRDKLAKLIGAKVQETEFDNVYGSRKVIKDANNPDQNHFYDEDLWTAEGKKLDGLIPENYIVYGELIGWTSGGAPIQHNYTYNCVHGTRRLYVYRVAFVNSQGTIADLSWDALKDFCSTLGLNYVPELWRGTKGAFEAEKWVDVKFTETGDVYPDAPIPLSDGSPCDEGVCIRIEGMIPQIYKLKSPIFLGHETALLDKGMADMETDVGEPEAALA